MSTPAVLTGVLLLATAVQGPSTTVLLTKLRKEAEQCKDVVGASNWEVYAVVTYRRELTNKGKCLLKCIYERLGIIKDGHFVDEKQAKAVFQELLKDDQRKLSYADIVVSRCLARATSSDDLCQGAYRGRVCFRAFRF